MKASAALMLTLLFAVLSISTPSDGQKLKRLPLLMLEETEQSAVSINSEEEYASEKPLKEEPKPTIRMTAYYIEPEFIPQPEIIKDDEEKDKPAQKPIKPEKKTEETVQEKTPARSANADQEKIVFWAKKFLSQNTRFMDIRGSRVAIDTDCSNFVRAVYWKALEVDLFYESVASGSAGADSRSGCTLLYAYFSKQHRYSKKPKKGDVVFFDNTYDKNRNKRWDDPLTHVGLVGNLTPDGTVTYIHGNTGNPKAIKEAFLSTTQPSVYQKDGKVINTYLRKKYEWEPLSQRKQLSGQLSRGFGGY